MYLVHNLSVTGARMEPSFSMWRRRVLISAGGIFVAERNEGREGLGFQGLFFLLGFIRTLRKELLIMRTLRFFSFGPSCSCWTAPLSRQRACTSAIAAHAFVSGIRFREPQGAIRDSSVQEFRPRSFASSFSNIYGGFGVSCHRGLYSSKVAS